MSQISRLHARQILDSRGNPTVEVEITLDDGSFGRAAVPSGASVGKHEVHELRDQQPAYEGKSVLQAVEHANNELCQAITGVDPTDQQKIDDALLAADQTTDLHHYGANAVLGVSLAVSKAAAAAQHLPYYQYIHHLFSQHFPESAQPVLPRPMFNILNGGAHTNWQTTDIQEFMIVPLTAPSFAEALRWGDEVYETLKKILSEKGYETTVGDEGGFAPALKHDQEAIELIVEAIQKAGYQVGTQIGLAIDAAASEWLEGDRYTMRIQHKNLSSVELEAYWGEWLQKYPIVSIEDPFAEDDWGNWTQFTAQHQGMQIVGDDLLVTNVERIQTAIEKKACTCLLMKPNQIGTLSASLHAIALAKKNGWGVVVSHRSGETEDTSIADIAVGTAAGQIKTGAPARSERLAKYNQLLRIEEEIGG